MNNRSIWGIIVVLILILLAVFYWWNPFGPADETEVPADNEEANQSWRPEKIAANHYFSEGTHTVEGTVAFPIPCYDLKHEIFTLKRFPPSIKINFIAQSTAEICTQVITEKFFSVEFDAPADAVISATWNGVPLELVLSESGSGVTK